MTKIKQFLLSKAQMHSYLKLAKDWIFAIYILLKKYDEDDE